MRIPADKNKKLILAAMLTALALALSLVDSRLSAALPYVPGVKLGLANIVTLFAVYTLGLPWALAVTAARALLTALMSGNLTMLLFSLGGGIAAVLIMSALRGVVSIIKVSVSAAVAHNLIQLALASLVTNTASVGYYAPALIAAGALTGFIIGVLVKSLLWRMNVRLPVRRA